MSRGKTKLFCTPAVPAGQDPGTPAPERTL